MGFGDDAMPVRDADIRVVGPWRVAVQIGTPGPVSIHTVARPERRAVAGELHESLPIWNPDEPGWARSAKFAALASGGHNSRLALDTRSVRIRRKSDGAPLARSRDFDCEDEWGTLGRLAGGAIRADEPVLVDYVFEERRLDSLVLRRDGIVELRHGTPALATPEPVPLGQGEIRLANLWIKPGTSALRGDLVFPILETRFPESAVPAVFPAEIGCPKALAKLRSGQPLRILAWGDSVTQGYPGAARWQDLFVEGLRHRFPKARIELVTKAWGAHNMGHFLDAPAGHPGNFREQVIGVRPDLVVSEFVNDTVLPAERVLTMMGAVLAEFRAIGAEWIVQTPHYMLPEWMGMASERDCDTDPRPVVGILRKFAAANHLPLADAARRWGRLWRQGFPYTTWMVNCVNHPDTRGMRLYAETLLELFPGGREVRGA